MTRLFRPKASVRAMDASGRSLYFYELVMAPGPAVVGDTGDGSAGALFGTNWVTLINRDDLTLHAFKEGPLGTWTEETVGLPSSFGSALPSTVRRLSHAFDQAARIIVAWEDSGTITATRWDAGSGAYASDMSFAGVNPCLLMQTTVDQVVGGSDIWLFYQRTDAPGEIFYRLQRDAYAVEYSLFTDASIAILDRAVALPYRFELWVSDQYGTPLQALVSDFYPVPLSQAFPWTVQMDTASTEALSLIQAEAEPVTARFAAAMSYATQILGQADVTVAPDTIPFIAAMDAAESHSQQRTVAQGPESASFAAAMDAATTEAQVYQFTPPTERVPFGIAMEGAEYRATS